MFWSPRVSVFCIEPSWTWKMKYNGVIFYLVMLRGRVSGENSETTRSGRWNRSLTYFPNKQRKMSGLKDKLHVLYTIHFHPWYIIIATFPAFAPFVAVDNSLLGVSCFDFPFFFSFLLPPTNTSWGFNAVEWDLGRLQIRTVASRFSMWSTMDERSDECL